MAEVGQAVVALIPSARGFGARLNQSIGGDIDKSGQSAGRRFAASMGGAMRAAAKGGMIAVGAAAGASVIGGFKSAVNQQNAQKVFAGLYGSTSKATTMMNDLRKVASGSAIDYSAYTQAGQSLAYAGIQGKDAVGILKNVGKAIVAAGGDSTQMQSAMGGVMKAVNNGGIAMMDSLSMISESGVPILSGLGKKFGKSTDQIKKMASSGKITIQDVMDVMQKGTGKTFQDMIKAGNQADKSFGNTFKRIKDNVVTSIGTAMVPVLDKATPVLAKFGGWLEKSIPAGMSKMSAAAKTAVPYVKDMATALFKGQHGTGPFAVGSPVIQGLLTIRRTVISAAGAVRDVLGSAFDVVGPHLAAFGRSMLGVFSKLGPLFVAAFGVLKSAAQAAMPFIKALAVVIGVGLVAAMKVLPPVLSVAVTVLTKLLNILSPLIPVILAGAAAFTAYKAAVFAANVVSSAYAAAQYSMRAAQVAYTAVMNGGTGAVVARTAAEKVAVFWAKLSTIWTGKMTIAQKLGATATWAMTAAQRALNVSMRLNPIGLVITALVALGAGLVIAYKKSETFRRIVQGAWNGIKAAALATVSWFTGTAWPFMRNVFGWIGQRALWLYRSAILPAWNGIRAAVLSVVRFFTAYVWPALTGPMRLVAKVVIWLARFAFATAVALIIYYGRAAANFFKNYVWPVFRAVFGWIAARAKWLYQNGIRPPLSWITNAGRAVANFFSKTVWPILRNVFGWIGGRAKWLYTSGIRPAFQWITSRLTSFYRFFRDTVWGTAIKGTLGKIRDGFEGARDFIGGVWSELKGLLAKPINAVIGFINSPLISGINALVPKKMEIKPLTKIKGYDRGGWTGPGARMTPAGVVHADEFVVRKSSRRTIERAQPGLLDAMNRHGAKALGYSTGGRVGSYYGQAPGYAKGGRVGGHSWPLIWDYVRKHFPGVTMTSNYRPGSMSLRKSSHALGTAIDIGGSRSAISKVMTHMAKHYGRNMRDLIYSPLWGHKMISDGKWISTPSFLYRTHFDHGHIGLMPGRGLSGGGVPGGGGLGIDLMGPFKKAIEGLTSKFSGSPLSSAPVEFVKDKMGSIGSWVADKVASFLNFATPSGVSGGIKNAIPEAQRYLLIKQALATVGLDPNNSAYQKATYNRAMKESGWDAGITQKVRDINSRRGDPAVGLMQIIGSTFRKYRDPRLPNDRRNPLASLVAAMRYAMAKYGSITAGFNRRGGYADGGLVKPIPGYAKGGVTKPGLSLVGERGPELMYTPGGSRVYSNAESQRMVGTTNFHVTINGVDTDNADEVVKALRFEFNRNGRYVGVS